MVTIEDLGILRSVSVDGGHVVVEITPTYSGCPAMTEIRHDVARRLREAGIRDVDVRLRLDPPWSSDAITATGRSKLAAAGIAPPSGVAPASTGPVPLTLRPIRREIPCPQCGSADTVELSAFGSTACKALYRCQQCAEPFDYFKSI